MEVVAGYGLDARRFLFFDGGGEDDTVVVEGGTYVLTKTERGGA